MPESIKFVLSGKQAAYTKPDVNEKVYFTYNNIHKIALLGMIGAMLGLSGWEQFKRLKTASKIKPTYPEFYEKLKDLEVAIIPNTPNGYFSKKIQYFNNSVGYASKEAGGNLQVFEQVLENPSWTIYLKQGGLDEELWNKTCNIFLKSEAHHLPNLGKKKYPATIKDVQKIEVWETSENYCNSLFKAELSTLGNESQTHDCMKMYIFMEMYPTTLQKDYGFYQCENFLFTNCVVPKLSNLFTDSSKIIYFF